MNPYAVVAYINIDEAIVELKLTLRQMLAEFLKSGCISPLYNYNIFADYDPTQLMTLVIKDIKAAFHEASQTEVIHQLLISQGVTKNIADHLSIEIPKLVVDAIAAHFPNFAYTELALDCDYEYMPPNTLAVRFPVGTNFV